RTAVNAQKFQGVPLGITPGMAVGCYFIPIYSIFGPCMSMREIVRVSFRDQPNRSVLALVVPWWLCYFFATVSVYWGGKLAEASFGFYLKLLMWDVAAAMISYIIVRLGAVQAETVVEEITPQIHGPRPTPKYATLPPLS
ncbi:MAG: hypothetical protein JWO82_3158, partial [Akkermansiaceae bacterium]|nr:hypothetical protein [Akkermansiaceae bacterium]